MPSQRSTTLWGRRRSVQTVRSRRKGDSGLSSKVWVIVRVTISALSFFELFQSRPFVHGHMVGLVALDQILRLLLRGVDLVPLECDFRRDFLLDGPSDSACLRVPRNMIAYLEVMSHRNSLL